MVFNMDQDLVLSVDSLDEIERSKRAQAPYIAEALRFDPIYYSTNFRLNQLHQTTLQTAAKQETKSISSRPQLPQLSHTKQTKALAVELAQAIQRNEKILEGIVQILVKNIHAHNEVIVKLSKEDEKHLNELLEELSKKENANTIKSLLNIVTSSTAITIGATLLAPESIAAITATAAGAALYSSISSVWAYLLIVTGISNIVTNEILPKIGGYEKMAGFFTSSDADRKKLAENIQITTSFTNTIMGVVSSIATSPLIGAVFQWSHGLKLLNTTLELSTGAVNFASDLNEHSFNNLQARQTQLDGKLNLEQSNLDKDFGQLHSAADLEQSFNKISFNIFETLRKIQEQNTK